MAHLLPLIALLTIVSCDKAPEKTSAQLRDDLRLAAQAAKESALKSDAPAAREAAGRAAAALDQLRKLHAPTTESQAAPDSAAFIAECETEARNAGEWATTASEKEARDEKLASWRARTYYAVESGALKIFFHGLALAADQAATGNLKVLPQSAQDGAKSAAEFIESYSGPQRLASGDLDWQSVSREIKTFAESPPTDLRLLMAFLMLVGMDFDSAFYEIEAIPAAQLKTLEQRAFHHLIRGGSYLGQGYGQLAIAEFELADSLSDNPDLKLDPARKCGLHLFMSFYFLREKRWSDADRALASANRAWPDNPVVVYLTGERQIAGRDYAAADESFAKALKGTDYEWLAERIAARIKRLRDNPASLEPVLFDYHLIADMTWSFIKNQSKESDTLRALQDRIDAAQSFIQQLKTKIPDVEVKMPDLKNLFKQGAEPPDGKK